MISRLQKALQNVIETFCDVSCEDDVPGALAVKKIVEETARVIDQLLCGFLAILISALLCNLLLTAATSGSYFQLGFTDQPIAHNDAVWNFLGMYLAGFGCVLLGSCPLRQLVLSGEGNTDSAVAVLGLAVGAAFAHNFGLASSAKGATVNGQIAVVIGIVVVLLIAVSNTFRKENNR